MSNGGHDQRVDSASAKVVDLRHRDGLTCLIYPLGTAPGVPGGRGPASGLDAATAGPSRWQAQALVSPGDEVVAGQCIALPRQVDGAPIHAARSGWVRDPRACAERADLAGWCDPALAGRALVLEVAPGEAGTEVCPLEPEPGDLAPARVALGRLRRAGVTGHGGAGFPLAAKIDQALQWPGPRQVVLNAVECEPPLACDRIALEAEGPKVLAGLAEVADILGPVTATVVVSARTEAAMRRALALWDRPAAPAVVRVPHEYTLGDERRLLARLNGRDLFARARPSHEGVVVLNVGTALAVARAIIDGCPQIERYLTVHDARRDRYWQVRAPLGALAGEVLALLGIDLGSVRGVVGNARRALAVDPAPTRAEPAGPRLRVGGDWMGYPIGPQTPITVGTHALSVHPPREDPLARACIRCGRCDAACPYGLRPERMLNPIGVDDPIAQGDLERCTLCAQCVPGCPSQIPITRILATGKEARAAAAMAERDAAWADARSKAHATRVERRRAGAATRSAVRSAARGGGRRASSADSPRGAWDPSAEEARPATSEQTRAISPGPVCEADARTRVADAVARVRARRARRAETGSSSSPDADDGSDRREC